MHLRPRLQLFLLLVLFFVSGASALMFETLWQRLMVLVLGASAPATAAILMAFFIGAGVGGLAGGRLVWRFQNPLACYAVIELWIGVTSLFVPPLVRHLDELLRMFGDASAVTWWPYAIRLALAVLVVLPATMGMGATIPVMNAVVHSFLGHVGKSTALAYGLNVLGAVAGTLVSGFLLIRFWGMQNALYFAASLNAFVVLVSFLLWRAGVAVISQHHEAESEREIEPQDPLIMPRLFLLLYFATGFLALAYEVLWLRILAIYTSTSTTTFALVLAIYLSGFSLGSLALFPLLAKRFTGARIFLLSNLLTGVCAFASAALVYHFPQIRDHLSFPRGMPEPLTWWRVTLVEVTFAAVLVFLPTVFMGLAYPAVCQALVRRGRDLPQRSGDYYFVGSLAAAVGVGVTGLWIIPQFGLVATLAILCIASVIISMVLLYVWERQLTQLPRLAACIVLVVAMAAYGVAGAPYVRDGRLHREGANWAYDPISPRWLPSGSVARYTILSYEVGPTATVVVKEQRPKYSPQSTVGLYIDEHHVASTSSFSVIDAKMLAHLPLMLHPAPRLALTVGFGSGGTSWSMSRHGVETTAVEIEPAVIRTAPFFRSQNSDVLQQPDFRLVLNDARNHLLMTELRYDVISTDVTNLQYRQNSALYSVEYFELMKSRLTDNGIACAWIPMLSITDAEFAMLLRSFQAAFPHASLWFMDYSDTRFAILIGTPGPVRVDMRRLRQMADSPQVREDLQAIGLADPLQLPLFLYLDEAGYRQFADDGPLHTDDRPRLEFSSPVSHYNYGITDEFVERLRAIRGLRPANYACYLLGATTEEAQRLQRFEGVHRKWAEVLDVYLFDKQAQADREHFRGRIQSMVEDVLELDPEFEPARKLQAELR
jgi:spermidine synthase